MSNYQQYEILQGSFPRQLPAAVSHEVSDNLTISVTIQLRRRRALVPHAAKNAFISHAELTENHGAKFEDVMQIFEFAHYFGLAVEDVHIGSRTVNLSGTAANICSAFRVRLLEVYENGAACHVPDGPVMLPLELVDAVRAVVGLDNRPKAKPHFRLALHDTMSGLLPSAFTGDQLAKIYDFPLSSGAGEVIGIIELGGGYLDSDVAKYFSDLGLPAPVVKAVSVAGANNAPGGGNADIEVALDIQVAGAVSPNSQIVVYFAPNTEQGFLQAILACIHDTQNKCSIMSISWGAAETNWTSMQMTAMDEAFQAASLLGISVFAAAGDDGANDNVNDGQAHVDFPASSPNLTACGGTALVLVGGLRIETAWNDGDGSATGGGISSVFPRPAYQSSLTMPTNLNGSLQGRGVPDLSAVADPRTGYKVYVGGNYVTVGGTSAVAPLLAGYMARINSISGKSHGLINLALYGSGDATAFNDIKLGNNSCDGVIGYTASAGWDPLTGFGSPSGLNLQRLLGNP